MKKLFPLFLSFLVYTHFCWPLLNPAASQTADWNLSTEKQLALPGHRKSLRVFWQTRDEGSFTGAGDIPIRYCYIHNEAGKGAVVIVNGRGESFLKYIEASHDLHKQGYSVYMYDHRGQGLSGRIVNDPMLGHVEDFDNYLMDLEKFYRQVVRKKENGNIYLLSHSMGGAVAALYLAKHPDHFQAAVLSSPMMEINTGIVPVSLACKTAQLLHGFRKFLGWDPGYVPLTGPYREKSFEGNRLTHSILRYKLFISSLYEKNPMIRMGGPTSQWVTEACLAARETRQYAGRIETPVLLLQAGGDQMVAAAGQEEFCTNLAAGGKSICQGGGPDRIEGAYHEILMEKDEYRIPALTRILEFFRRFSVRDTSSQNLQQVNH